ncbi:hypothetical protein MXMO3_02641 [Maritalea myrionectae]|uniref:DUF1491 family protein n=1 Tax=Maritalea myrionectae TaxID=454601 RepID=A0A2R4MGR8_9HYPH|nr:DUF1491 family protein [Maritalea myrionectae]AVX05153.1 hypothetical protein MXMO3_02641 [Maritalea myrionectae]
MKRLRADLWVSAFIRLHTQRGNMCVIRQRGDEIAGQIWIEVDHLDGSSSLYVPAMQLEPDSQERIFEARFDHATYQDVNARIQQEQAFDPDFWVISLETRDTDIGLNVSESSA